jgi:hypothetical protein
MSDKVNSELFDRAAEMYEYWVGTPIARVIEADMARNDLEGLRQHVLSAEAIASQDEFEAADMI